MAQSNEYKLKRLQICYPDNPNQPILPNTKDIVSEITIYSSIETPYIKADVVINDPGEGFHDLLKGNELLRFEIESDFKQAGGPITFKCDLFCHRISDRVKSERQEAFKMEFITQDTLINEWKRVNKVYKKQKISDIVTDLLKKELGTKELTNAIESTDRPVTIVSPNWRPFDAISWTCHHATRSSKTTQTGYVFYFSAREGYVFRSVDYLFEQNVRLPQLQEFVYRQKNLGAPGQTGKLNPQLDDIVSLDYVKYNDVTKDLEQMRLGSYAGTVTGIDMCDLNTTQVKRYRLSEMFNKMSHAEKVKPFGKSVLKIDQRYTRQYLVGLPTYMYSDEGKGSGLGALSGNVVDKTMEELLYSTLRYVSMKHFVLNIKIPGNTTISAGDCIKITIPTKDRNKGASQALTDDPIYSGKYVVASVIHQWTPDKLVTMCTIIRDTQWKDEFKK